MMEYNYPTAQELKDAFGKLADAYEKGTLPRDQLFKVLCDDDGQGGYALSPPEAYRAFTIAARWIRGPESED